RRDAEAYAELRSHYQYRRGVARPGSFPLAAASGRNPRAGRRPRASASVAVGLQSALRPALAGGLGHRRDPGDPGDARLLREEEDRLGHREDPRPEDQRGVRAHAEGRLEVSLRRRHEIAEGLGRAVGNGNRWYPLAGPSIRGTMTKAEFFDQL